MCSPAKIIIYVVSFTLLVPCALLFAQGTTNPSVDSAKSPSSTISKPNLPKWVTSGYNHVSGLGIAHVSEYNTSIGYTNALKNAVEDLNSNVMITLYAESFNDGYTTGSFDEFSIREEETLETVVKVDSAIYGDYAYYLVTRHNRNGDSKGKANGDSLSVPLPATFSSEDSISTFLDGAISETKMGPPTRYQDFYVATGQYYYSQYAPYRSLAKAKMNALKRLGHYLQTSVSKLDKRLNNQLQTLTYTTTKMIFTDLLIISRSVKNDTCYVTVAVNEDNVTSFNE